MILKILLGQIILFVYVRYNFFNCVLYLYGKA